MILSWCGTLDIFINRHLDRIPGKNCLRWLYVWICIWIKIVITIQVKCGVLKNSLEHAHWVSDKDHLEDEWKHLVQVFLRNGYSIGEIKRTMMEFDSKLQAVWNEDDGEPIHGVAVVPFYQPVTNQLNRLLRHRSIKIMSYPLTQLKRQMS